MQYGPRCHPKGITGYGNPEHGVVILGIAPGRDEILTGRPFTGRSGKLLDKTLEQVGWHRDKCYATNIVCWNIDAPSAEDIARCAPRLQAELADIKPRLVMLMGKIVTEAYLPGRKFGDVRGAIIWNKDHYVISTYHPAAIVRGGVGFTVDLVNDLSKIKHVVNWPSGGSVAQVDYHVIDSHTAAQQMLDTLPLDKPVALDVETDSLNLTEFIDVYGENIISMAISTGDETWVIPQEFTHDLRWPKDVQWTYHNGMYDTQAMRRHLGVQLPIVHDTMLQHYSLDERTRKGLHKLKPIAREWLGADFYEEEIHKYSKVGYQKAPKDTLHEYNAKDACYTARLQPLFHRMQIEDDVQSVYNNLLIPAANVFSDVSYRGIKIDMDMVRQLSLEWFPRWLSDEQALVDMAGECGWDGIKPINLNSPKQLSRLLYDIIGLPGGPSTAKDILEDLVADHPFIPKLLAFRKLDKLIGTYLLGIQGDIKRDGCIHPYALLHGTVTGRMSFTDPPIQTIPQPGTVGEDLARIRNIFVPKNIDTHVVVEVDYGKAEVWCAYVYSKDPALLEDLQNGDYHTNVATKVFNKPASAITKNERKAMKYVTFGIMYGRQAHSLAVGELQCSVAQAQAYIDAWKSRNKVYVQWAENLKRTLLRAGEVVSYTGRKRRFLYVDPYNAVEIYNQAVNMPVQALASDCTLSSLIELHPILKELDSYIWFPIHDAIAFEVAKAHLDEALCHIKRVFTSPRFPGMPGIPIEISIGPRWGMTKEVTV